MNDDCQHNWKFLYSNTDWWDGSVSEDVYECEDCGEMRWQYISR